MEKKRSVISIRRVVTTVALLLYFISAAAFHSQQAANPIFFINQAGFDSRGPKQAIIQTEDPLPASTAFTIIDSASGKAIFSGVLKGPFQIDDWTPGKWYYQADFSSLKKAGKYQVYIIANNKRHNSCAFLIGENDLKRKMVSAIIHYYHRQRANTPEEWKTDEHLKLFGSDQTVDMRGGWCDASGDVSKYFSHLAYANFMSPQQTPLVTWSMISADEAIPVLLIKWKLKDSLENEALWGADYMMRALAKDDFFYMIVFS